MHATRLLPIVWLGLVLGAAGCTAGEPESEEVAGTVDTICCGAACCLIDGSCRASGETNPADRCQRCNPANSQTSWTTQAGCGGTDSGGGGTDAGGGGGGGGGCAVSALPAAKALALVPFLAGLILFVRRSRAR
jgi:hypothetical protein